MSQIPAFPFERSESERVAAGVCGGIAARLKVDATLVRLVFALLALAGGAGILLYLGLWAASSGRRPWLGAALVAVSAAALLFAVGLSGEIVLGTGLAVAGLAVVAVRGGSFRPGGSIPFLGGVLLVAGAVTLLGNIRDSQSFVGPGAVLGALVLVIGPWLWQLSAERTERIRLQGRADVAARVHDSVLQTLALVQRHADDPARVASIARRQEHELRRWLYGGGLGDATTLAAALEQAVAEIEELHRVRIELASAGDTPLDERVEQVVLAAREAMTNAAKFAASDEISVYSEATPTAISVYVRDRGAGFDRAAVDPGRRGIAESIEGRLARAGGSVTITTAPGAGTEVELTLPLDGAA